MVYYFNQPLLRVRKEDNFYSVILERYDGDYHSDIYVSDVLRWSNAGGIERWGVVENYFTRFEGEALYFDSTSAGYWIGDNVPPPAPGVWSDTHPDQSVWYARTDVTLHWSPPFDNSGIALVLVIRCAQRRRLL